MKSKPINYDTYCQERASELFQSRVTLRRKQTKRLPRQRLRDPEEDRLLGQMIQARYRRLIDCGELEQIGSRKWRWHFVEFDHPTD